MDPSERVKRRILIGICSCQRHAEKRAAARETWLQRLPPEISAAFFVGGGGEAEESDVIQLPTNDDYARLPKKVRAFFQYALAHYDFDYLFKCDDDTYVFCDRLSDLLKGGPDFIGSADYWPGHADGGAGYLLSRTAVRIVAEAECPDSGPEDVWVTKTLQDAKVLFLSSPRLLQDYHRVADRGGKIITAHHCPPEILREIHRWPSQARDTGVAMSFYARHPAWHGPFKLLSSGFFIGGAANPNGRWMLAEDGSTLTIAWFDWPKDMLHKTVSGYSNSTLTLESMPTPQDSLEERLGDPVEKLHLGCGANILPGWRNHDLDMDIRVPLPFPDDSIHFVFAEHLVEHVAPGEAWTFFREVRRVLKPGGVFRVIVPCVELVFRRYDTQYAEFLRRVTATDGSRESAIECIACGWGHKCVWTVEAVGIILQALGFSTAKASPGKSPFQELRDIDGHARSIGGHANWVESGVVEAVKWLRSCPDGSRQYPVGWELAGGLPAH